MAKKSDRPGCDDGIGDEDDDSFLAGPELEEHLVTSVEQARRGETVSGGEVMRRLRARASKGECDSRELDDLEWDREIEEDVAAGRLDEFGEEVLEEYRRGETKNI